MNVLILSNEGKIISYDHIEKNKHNQLINQIMTELEDDAIQLLK